MTLLTTKRSTVLIDIAITHRSISYIFAQVFKTSRQWSEETIQGKHEVVAPVVGVEYTKCKCFATFYRRIEATYDSFNLVES